RCLLDRRKAQPDVGIARLLGNLSLAVKDTITLGQFTELRRPLTVLAIEEADTISLSCPHHMDQVVRLLLTRHDAQSFSKRCSNVETQLAARVTEFVFAHARILVVWVR